MSKLPSKDLLVHEEDDRDVTKSEIKLLNRKFRLFTKIQELFILITTSIVRVIIASNYIKDLYDTGLGIELFWNILDK